VLISGPIASGKTAVAHRLAAAARARGVRAAAVDMDELIEMVAGDDWSLVGPGERELACDLAAALIEHLFKSGILLATVAGSTLSSYEWDSVMRHLDSEAEIICVLLRVSLAESLRRAQTDPLRVATKDAELVAQIYADIDWDNVAIADIEVVTDYLSLEQVVNRIERAVFAET
jgi:shikimate kinase